MKLRSHHWRAPGSRRRAARRGHGAVGVPHRGPRRAPRRAWLHRRRQRRPAGADSRNAGTARRAQEIHPRHRQGLPEALSDALASLDEGALPLVLGGDHSLAAGSVAAAAEWASAGREAADRPALDRRARRHEHAGDLASRQRARHAAGRAARTRSRRSWRRIGDDLAEGAAGAHRARRRPQPGRAREGRGSRFARPRLHDEGHRSAGHRVHRRAGREPGRHRHRRHPRVVRSWTSAIR